MEEQRGDHKISFSVPQEAPSESSLADIDLIDIRNDPRAIWIKNRIMAFIGLNDESLFYNMFDEPDRLRMFTNFITEPIKPNEMELDKKTFYVTKIIVDKLIHDDKEFTEWRLVPPPPPPPPPPPKHKKGKGKKEKEKEPEPPAAAQPEKVEGVKSAKSVKSLKSMKSLKSVSSKSSKVFSDMEAGDDIENTAVAMEENEGSVRDSELSLEQGDVPLKAEDSYFFPPPPEDLDPEIDGTIEFYTIIRPVPRIIQYPKLIPIFGAFTPQVTNRNCRYIYFVRQSQHGVPLDQNPEVTMATMPEKFLVGLTSGRVLKSLGLQLKESFIPLFKRQFREVTIAEDDAGSESRRVSIAGRHDGAKDTDEGATQVNYLRPSDYRRMSNIARGENAEKRIKNMRTASGGLTSPRSKSIREQFEEDNFEEMEKQGKTAADEVTKDITELVGIVDWTIEHIEGEIHLPMPMIPALQDEHPVLDLKDQAFIDQLQEAVTMWENHIDATITACLGKTRQGNGPVAEYKYWRERDAELSLLVEQLKQPIVVMYWEFCPTPPRYGSLRSPSRSWGRTVPNT